MNMLKSMQRQQIGFTSKALLLGIVLIPINYYWLLEMEVIRFSGLPTLYSLFFNAVFIVFVLLLLSLPLRKFGSLSSEEDAFGQKLWAAYNREEVFEIVERDDGYIDAMKIKGYFADYEDWSQIEQEAMKFVKGRTLDIGCGAGRHSLYLQRKGCDVLGVDISPLAIEVCKLRGLKKYKVI